MSKSKSIDKMVETELRKMFDDKGEPNPERMKLLKLGMTYLAIKTKLSEAEYGNFFSGTDDDSEGKEPATRSRKGNGAAATGALDLDS